MPATEGAHLTRFLSGNAAGQLMRFRRGLRAPGERAVGVLDGRRTMMARWYKDESMGKAIAREGGEILSSAGKDLLSIATLGFYRPGRSRPEGRIIEIRYPSGKVIKIR